MNTKTKQIMFFITLGVLLCMSTCQVSFADEVNWSDFDAKQYLPKHMLITEGTADIEYATGYRTQSIGVEVSTVIIDVPILYDSEDVDRLGTFYQNKVEEDIDNFGVPSLIGEKTYLVKNTTDNAYTTLNIADNYAVSSYYYLLFESLGSKNGNEAITLTISFGKTVTANISDIAETYNKTLIDSEVMPLPFATWYNLVAETNTTFSYVINVCANNIDVKGFYIFQLEKNRYIVDSRYQYLYLNNYDAPLLALSDTVKIGGNNYVVLKGSSQVNDFNLKAETISALNVTKILSVPMNLDYRTDMFVQSVGWLTANDLENSLKIAWKDKLISQGKMTAEDRIVDYNLTRSFWRTTINKLLAWRIRDEIQNRLKITTDYRSIVTGTMNKIMPLMQTSNKPYNYELIEAQFLDPNSPRPLLDVGDFGGGSPAIAAAIEEYGDITLNLAEDASGHVAIEVTPTYPSLDGVPPGQPGYTGPLVPPAPVIADEDGHIANPLTSTNGVNLESITEDARTKNIAIIIMVSVGGLFGIVVIYFFLRMMVRK